MRTTTHHISAILGHTRGADPDELKSRSKMIKSDLRKIRMLERQAEQDGDFWPLQRAWSSFQHKCYQIAEKPWVVKPTRDHLRAEFDQLELAEPPQYWAVRCNENEGYGWYHKCNMMMPGGDTLDLGTFYVHVPYQMGSDPMIFPAKNCYKYNSSHPHVGMSYTMCTGQAGPLMRQLRNTHDIAAISDIIAATLDTFNPDSPYWRPDSMLRDYSRCVECGKSDEDDELIVDPEFEDNNGMYRPRLLCLPCYDERRRRAFKRALRRAEREADMQAHQRRLQ
jgi:hypothetical protein